MSRISTVLINELQFSLLWRQKAWSQGQTRQWALSQPTAERGTLHWLQQQTSLWSHHFVWLWLLANAGVLFAALGSVTSLMHWQPDGQVNLLLVLAVLWLLPCLLLLATLLLWPWLHRLWWWQLLWQRYAQLADLRPLVLLLSQRLALLWLLISWLTLMFWLLVDDFYFVWSSTLNVPTEAWQALLNTMAWPWSWYLPQWTIDSQWVVDNRQWQGQPMSGGVDRQWWPFISLSMLTWLLLPRVLLWAMARLAMAQAVARCRQDLAHQQFQQWLSQPQWQTAVSRSQVPGTQATELSTQQLAGPVLAISWQQARPELSHQLGVGDVRDDLRRLQQWSELAPHPVQLWVLAKSQPLAELADLLLSLPQARLPGELVVLADGEHSLDSWQLFVSQQLPHFRIRRQSS